MIPPFLKNHVCLVTGGAQGVGWATAQAMADYGGEVFVADISRENLEAAKTALQNTPWRQQIRFAECDVTDYAAVSAWIQAVYHETGHIEVLVNNAVYVQWQSVETLPVAEHERMMQVSYNGMVYTIKCALPWLRQSAQQSYIVNIGSSAGKVFSRGGSAPYAAAKAAIDGFTSTLRTELDATNIHVLLVRPGIIGGTEFFGKYVPSTQMPRFADFVPALTPPQVAHGILKAMYRRRRVLDLPGYLKLMYWLHELSPVWLDRVVHIGGDCRSDLGALKWNYEPRAVKE